MNDQNRLARWLVPAIGLLAMIEPGTGAYGAGDVKPAHKVVGTLVSADATLLCREAPDKPWKPVRKNGPIYADALLLALPHALIEVKSGVQLKLQGDIEGRSPYPIVESVVRLNDSGEYDVDFVLERGQVTVVAGKDKPARVNVRFHGGEWTLRLKPEAQVALEKFGRWPKGAVFAKNPPKGDAPTQDLVVLMLHGEMTLHIDHDTYRMNAPPGGAFFEWDSVIGSDVVPRRMGKLPAWAGPLVLNDPEIKTKIARGERFRNLVMTKSVDAAITEFLDSDDPDCRRGAVYLIAAMDDIERLGAAVMTTKHRDVWDNGVLALRHWLGRCPGQDRKFYDMLVKNHNCAPAHAETILQLTRSFSDQDLASPECYEMLIEYLMHEKQAIRGLAYWHLYRLVPEGRRIKYSPLDSKDDRELAYKEWKRLIPEGKLPPSPKKPEQPR